jgi:beta-hydroxylase
MFKRIGSDGWKKFYIKWYGQPTKEARLLCPKTTELIESIPGIRLAMFSWLDPGTIIPLHKGPSNTCVRYHLGLDTPNDDNCKITVDGIHYSWRDGKAVFFDDTYMHEVQNSTSKRRLILFCDVDRKMDTVTNQKFVSQLCDRFGHLSSNLNSKKEKTSKI